MSTKKTKNVSVKISESKQKSRKSSSTMQYFTIPDPDKPRKPKKPTHPRGKNEIK